MILNEKVVFRKWQNPSLIQTLAFLWVSEQNELCHLVHALQEKRNQTTLIRQRLVEKVLHENDRQLLILSIQKVLSEP